MTDMQAHEIITDCIKAHWPGWEFKGRELAVWIEELRKFDYQAARQGADACYREWEGKQYPRMKTILRFIRKHTLKKVRSSGMREYYRIGRADGRLRWFPFWGTADAPQQDVEEDAAEKLGAANHIEAGHYIVWPKQESAATPF